MKYSAWLSTAFVFALLLTSGAYAQRIPDLSLSPEETARQPTNVPVKTFKNDITRRSEAFTPPGKPAAPETIADRQDHLSDSFMERYCEPNFISMLANNRKYYGQEECLKLVRDDACARFKALPKEVAKVLDEAIDCLFANSNGFAVDKYQHIVNESAQCADSYVQRINMLKIYYTDYYTNYALLFMPDDVLDTPGRCVNRN
jgi:hypothetical protein